MQASRLLLKYFRPFFRVLRPDELSRYIKPVVQLKGHRTLREKAFEHITDGSSNNYRSSLVSCTSELNVALAFGGVLHRIAVIDPGSIADDKILYLDRDYLRQACLIDQHAISRSRRSDEVVVDSIFPVHQILNVRVLKCERQLCPGFEQEDACFFPDPSAFRMERQPKSRLGGANKRLLKLDVGGGTFVAHSPRPNVSLDYPLLFNEDLLAQCRHEFASFCVYRHLTAPPLVPKCALYTLDLEYDSIPGLLPDGGKFKWAFILMENIEPLNEPLLRDVKGVATRLFGADILMGNWGCADGDDVRALAENIVYAKRVSDNAVVRVAVDRALGNVYPEDMQKSDKIPIEFSDSTTDLRINLLQRKKFLYGHLDERAITQTLMSLQLDRLETTAVIEQCVRSVEWPPYSQGRKSNEKILDVLVRRQDHVLKTLPYHYMPTKSMVRPSARDGHAAASFPETNTMFILGGNTSNGPVKDVWKLDLTTAMWERMKDIPGHSRDSFSANAWTSQGSQYLVVFGGGSSRGKCMNDLLLFHVESNSWHHLSLPAECTIAPRCRHASTWSVDLKKKTATLHIIGGHDTKKSRKDVYKIVLMHDSAAKTPEVISCDKMQDLPAKSHRAFAFQLPKDRRILMFGGFGPASNLRKIQVVHGSDSRSIPTHGVLDAKLPSNLSGFGAVVDVTDHRVVLFGGGQIHAGSERKSLGKSMGVAPAHEQPFRMLYLTPSKDSLGREEWKWYVDEKHELLDNRFRLPVRTSWSACLMNHKIILFGGRHGEEFSNDTIVLQLRPGYVTAKEEILECAKTIQCALDEVNREWGQVAFEDAWNGVTDILRPLKK